MAARSSPGVVLSFPMGVFGSILGRLDGEGSPLPRSTGGDTLRRSMRLRPLRRLTGLRGSTGPLRRSTGPFRRWTGRDDIANGFSQ